MCWLLVVVMFGVVGSVCLMVSTVMIVVFVVVEVVSVFFWGRLVLVSWWFGVAVLWGVVGGCVLGWFCFWGRWWFGVAVLWGGGLWLWCVVEV